MRILITGASGLVGYRATQLLCATHTIIPTANEIPEYLVSYRAQVMDITDAEAVRRTISTNRPDVVLHCAAHTVVDRCETEPALAQQLNVEGTRNVAGACRAFGAKLVYLSTDYVFDGRDGPYAEDATPHPLSVYGNTKLAGEEVVRELPTALIVRTTVVYGIHPTRKSFPVWLAEELHAGRAAHIVDDQWSTPTFADQLVQAIAFLLERNAVGVWNVGDATYCNRYDFAVQIATLFGLDASRIIRTSTAALRQAAVRPLRGGLRMDKLRAAGFPLRDSATCLRELKRQLVA